MDLIDILTITEIKLYTFEDLFVIIFSLVLFMLGDIIIILKSGSDPSKNLDNSGTSKNTNYESSSNNLGRVNNSGDNDDDDDNEDKKNKDKDKSRSNKENDKIRDFYEELNKINGSGEASKQEFIKENIDEYTKEKNSWYNEDDPEGNFVNARGEGEINYGRKGAYIGSSVADRDVEHGDYSCDDSRYDPYYNKDMDKIYREATDVDLITKHIPYTKKDWSENYAEAIDELNRTIPLEERKVSPEEVKAKCEKEDMEYVAERAERIHKTIKRAELLEGTFDPDAKNVLTQDQREQILEEYHEMKKHAQVDLEEIKEARIRLTNEMEHDDSNMDENNDNQNNNDENRGSPMDLD